MRARSLRYSAAFALLVAGLASPAFAGGRGEKMVSIDRMMVDLADESARDAAEIKRVYQDYLDLLVLDGYADLEGALSTGGLVPLPANLLLFNLAPRLAGEHPIGEKDLANQSSYVAARPSTIGLLLEIARRVHTSPLEITSLVRHAEYQDALRVTNANATTSVPMHTMGLAVDIALVNTPIETAYAVRDVLRKMRDAGDLLFIGERQQLVFHVVPHPSRLGYFDEVYAAAFGGGSQPQLLEAAQLEPHVVAEVVSMVPEDPSLRAAWFADGNHPPDAVVTAAMPVAPRSPVMKAGVTFGVLPMFAGMLAGAAAFVCRRRASQ